MRRMRLNLSALRDNSLRRLRHSGTPHDTPDTSDLGLSRREVLGLAGAAAVSASPVMAALDTSLKGPFELVTGRRHASFRLGGRERWRIDTGRFSGSPELAVHRSERLIRLTLKGARYPGTQLPADFTCELRQAVVGWKMKLKLALGGFEAEAPFERWLAGAVPARASIKLDDSICAFSQGKASLAGSAEADFRPDWTLRIGGRNIASIEAPGLGAASDSIEISLLDPKSPSVSRQAASRRTLISLNRGRRKWSTRDLPAPDGWTYTADGSPFDRIAIEAGENRSGATYAAVLADSRTDACKLKVSQGTAQLGLRNPRYALGFDEPGVDAALLADFDDTPTWLHAEGCSLQLGHSPEAAFEVVASNGGIRGFTCAPAVLALVTPLVGALTEAVKPAEGTTVDMAAAIRPVPGGVRPTPAPAPAAPPTSPAPTPSPSPSPITRPTRPSDIQLKPSEKATSAVVPMDFEVPVLRIEDLLALRFEFRNLRLLTDGTPRLVRKTPGSPAYVVVVFPPQSIVERAFYEATGSPTNEQPGNPPISARMAGQSRLVFRVPDKTTEIPYTLDALLDWKQFQPSLVPTALPPPGYYPKLDAKLGKPPASMELSPKVFDFKTLGKVQTDPLAVSLNPAMLQPGSISIKPAIKKPEAHETSIELPYRLMLSPHEYEGWAHSAKSVTAGGRTELWHTRLGLTRSDGTVDESDSPYRTLRAVWSPDYSADVKGNHNLSDPFRTPITKWQRYQIVGLCCDFTNPNYQPLPVEAEQLMLTSLGAWLRSRGTWNPRKMNFAVCEWKHIATMGRDHYVKVVEIGYLYPFGHLAVRTWVTERKFQQSPKNETGAYMRQRMFIVVLKPVVQYPPLGAPDMWKGLPFKKIRCATDMTPDLADPAASAVPEIGKDAFWPVYGTQPFAFHFVGEDWDGRHVEFQAPVIFTTFDVAFNRGQIPSVRKDYYNPAYTKRRVSDMRGQRIAYAESSKPGDTTYETVDTTFGGEIMINSWANAALINQMKEEDQPPFYPVMQNANLKVAAVQEMTGKDAPANIVYHEAYAASGLSGANKGEVFARITNPPSLGFGGGPDSSCGIAAPNMSIGGLSRGFGAVGGAADAIAKGTFDPMSFFSDAMLLGTIPLSNIISKITDFGDQVQAAMRIPRISSRPIYDKGNPLPVAIESTLNWQTSEIKNDTITETFLAEGNGQHCSLTLTATKRTSLGKDPSSMTIKGELKNFTVQLVPKIMHLIDVVFNNLTFTSENGKKPDVNADIAKVTFKGPLTFINPLEEFISGNGFSDPPFIDVTSEHVEAGYTLAIPTIGVGVFSLQNINLGARLTIPFIGKPVSMRFNFCEPHNPFLLTVSMFGGGGYFALEVNPNGVSALEGSLEFGGCFSMNLGVASGSVYLMAGVSYSRNEGLTKLSGYLRCGGSIEVLGLITVSLEFLMALDHYDPPSRLHGIATLTVEIEILFFSTSVDLTVERDFGGGGDPGFQDLMQQSDWNEYCDAFAA